MVTIDEYYLDDLVRRFKGFKSPNDTQQLIILLGEKDNRNDDDNRKLSVLMKAEKKADQLVKARADARRVIDADKAQARKTQSRCKIILQSAYEAMAAKSHETERILNSLTQKALDENYVSVRDKDLIIEYLNSK